MSHASNRAIRRANPARQGLPTMSGYTSFLSDRKVDYVVTGRPRGVRVLTASAMLGKFLSATFRHPTKAATAGRFSTVTWRTPDAA